jgi:uncharacterized Tic20 family protein
MTPEIPTQQDPLTGYTPTEDERTWGLIAHCSALLLSFIGPIIALVAKGNQSKWVRAQAIEALNFNITLAIVYAVGTVLTLAVVGICILIPAGLAGLVLSILAGVKAFQGQPYRYPFTLRLIKD